MNTKTKQMTVVALLSAVAYVAMVFGRIPMVLFLKYDPKDIIIAFGGFLFGPLTAFGMAALISLIEMITVSNTGPIGLLMNVVSTCSFVCVAAFIYKRKRTIWGAAFGLVAGVAFMTLTMLLWNYIVTPWFMGLRREVIRDMLLPVFLPFNLLKGGINAAAAMILYKPLITALRHFGMVPQPVNSAKKISVAAVGAALFVLISCILAVLIWQGRI